jgi:quercetin 2,3-dioxygenase
MDDCGFRYNSSRNAPKYDGLMQGFQLWVNLPLKKKMIAPKYRGIEKQQIPVLEKDGSKIKVIAGKVDETEGPVRDLAINIEYFDVELDAEKTFKHQTPKNDTVFAYLVEGSIEVGSKKILQVSVQFLVKVIWSQ